MVFPYVLVNKIGDSLITPTNILDLNSIHNVSVIDMNLNVSNFYNAVLNNSDSEEIEETKFLKILPDGSDFELYVKELDLSKKDYLNTEVIKRVCLIKNSNIISLD